MEFSYQAVGDSCYPGVGNGLNEGSRSEIVRDSIAWLQKNGYMIDPGEGSPQQESFSSPNHWNDYSSGDSDMTCTPCSAEFSSMNEEQKKNSFETTVIKRFDDLQTQIDRMALGNEEIGVRIRSNLQTDIMVMGTVLRTQIEEEFRAYEGRSIKRFEEYYEKIESMCMMLDSRLRSLGGTIESLRWSSQALDCRMDKLEQRLGQLYFDMYKALGKIVESESDDDCIECLYFEKELPGYVSESVEEYARHDKSATECEPTSLMPSAYNENEQLLCEDIASLRSGRLADATVSEHSMDTEDMRTWNFMACSPVENRNQSSGAELPSVQEESSSSPTVRACYSCELACAPQVQACFGVLASSTSRGKSHEEPSWEEEGSMVDVDEQQRKQKRQVSAQVWIPRGTLEVMEIFYMTELSLGEKSCVPYKAQKRRRRRKSSTPPGGVG